MLVMKNNADFRVKFYAVKYKNIRSGYIFGMGNYFLRQQEWFKINRCIAEQTNPEINCLLFFKQRLFSFLEN